MSDNYIVCLDTETGGLDCKKTDVLTLHAAICDEDLKILDELSLKLKPEGRLPICEDGALKVNKIDLKAHLADPATVIYPEGKKKFLTFLDKYLKKRGRYSNLSLLGQNVGFDKNFIFEYIVDPSTWNNYMSYNDEDTKNVCTFMKRCGWLPKDVGTLASLVEFFGIPKREAHEARGDVLMTIDVYKAQIALMKSKKSGGATQDLISLLEAE